MSPDEAEKIRRWWLEELRKTLVAQEHYLTSAKDLPASHRGSMTTKHKQACRTLKARIAYLEYSYEAPTAWQEEARRELEKRDMNTDESR